MKKCPKDTCAEQTASVLQDEELSEVSGGLMREFNGSKYMVVSPGYPCAFPEHFEEVPDEKSVKDDHWFERGIWFNLSSVNCCGRCNKYKFFPGTSTGYCPCSKE